MLLIREGQNPDQKEVQENRGFQPGGATIAENFAADFLQMQQTARQHSASHTGGRMPAAAAAATGRSYAFRSFDPLRRRLHYAGSAHPPKEPPP